MTQPTYTPLSATVHGDLRFTRGTLFFALEQPLLALALAEIPQAALHLPLGFVRAGSDWRLVAICSPTPEAGHNTLIAGNGLWLGGYVPAVLATQPFRLARAGDEVVVCADLASDWLARDRGEPLFDAHGQPGPILAGKIETLRQRMPDPAREGPVLALLDALGLLTPWAGLGAGLHGIDQGRLAALAGADLARLRDAGALALVYGQLFSLQRLPWLAHIAHQGDRQRQHEARLLELTDDAGDYQFQF